MSDLEMILELQREHTRLKCEIVNVFLFVANRLNGNLDYQIPEPENPELAGIVDRVSAASKALMYLKIKSNK